MKFFKILNNEQRADNGPILSSLLVLVSPNMSLRKYQPLIFSYNNRKRMLLYTTWIPAAMTFTCKLGTRSSLSMLLFSSFPPMFPMSILLNSLCLCPPIKTKLKLIILFLTLYKLLSS